MYIAMFMRLRTNVHLFVAKMFNSESRIMDVLIMLKLDNSRGRWGSWSCTPEGAKVNLAVRLREVLVYSKSQGIEMTQEEELRLVHPLVSTINWLDFARALKLPL